MLWQIITKQAPPFWKLEDRKFYAPGVADDHTTVLSFNNIPLPDSLIEAMVEHPELFPNDILIRWTQEQDLILEATLGQLRGQTKGPSDRPSSAF